MRYRITGIGTGAVDTQTDEIIFDLTIDGRPPMQFVATYGAISQFMGALGRMFVELRRVLLEKKAIKSTAAEEVASSYVQLERWENVVLMQLTTPQGTPYTFRIDPQAAVGIAEQLKIESAKVHQTGRA